MRAPLTVRVSPYCGHLSPSMHGLIIFPDVLGVIILLQIWTGYMGARGPRVTVPV